MKKITAVALIVVGMLSGCKPMNEPNPSQSHSCIGFGCGLQ